MDRRTGPQRWHTADSLSVVATMTTSSSTVCMPNRTRRPSACESVVGRRPMADALLIRASGVRGMQVSRRNSSEEESTSSGNNNGTRMYWAVGVCSDREQRTAD